MAYRIFPHRTAAAEAAEAEWWLEQDGQRLVCPDVLDSWDYHADLTVGVTLRIGGEDFLSSTGVGRLSALVGVLQVDCRSAQARFVDQARFGMPPEEEKVDLQVTMAAGSIADSLLLGAHVVLAEGLEERPPGRVPYRKGSRLLSVPSHRMLLEGDAGRFPTEAVSFRDLGLRDAPWTVSLTHDDMGDNFMGAVRLLINTDHAVAQRLLKGKEPERFNAAMTADLIRLLVAKLSHDVVSPEHWDNEDSMVNVLDTMCDTYLNCSFDEAKSLFRGDPVDFEALVQQKINPLCGFVS